MHTASSFNWLIPESEAHHAEEGNGKPLVAIVKQALVKECEEGIENCAVGLEDFVDERHLRCGQVAAYLPDVLIVFQAPHTQRAEQLLEAK